MPINADLLVRGRKSETAPPSLNATTTTPATAQPPGGDNATRFFID